MQGMFFTGIAVLAVLNYAVLAIIAKKVETVVPPFAFIAATMAVLTLSALVASLISEKSFSFSSLKASHIAFLVLFGLVNLVGFALFLKTITGMPVAHYQLILGVLSPVLTGLLAFLFLGQTLAPRFFIAIPIILIGLYIALIN